MPYSNIIEWEYLQTPVEFEILEPELTPKNSEKYLEWDFIKCYRNNKYEIKGEFLTYNSFRKINDFIDSVKNNNGFKQELESNSYLLTIEGNKINGSKQDHHKIKVFCDLNKVSLWNTNKSTDSVYFIKEWYLNGPLRINFNRTTQYFKQELIGKNRMGLQNFLFDNNFLLNHTPNFITNKDYIIVEPEGFPPFIIQKVPETFNPNWSHSLSIEYPLKKDIYDKEMRKKIHRIVSFIFGKYLVKIGETSFNKNGEFVQEYSMTPKISSFVSLKGISEINEQNPIFYNYKDFKSLKLEEDLKFMIDNYFKYEEEFNLSNVFKYVLNSMVISDESAIILINSALENLADSWFENLNNETKQNEINSKLTPEENKILMKELENYTELYEKIMETCIWSGRKTRNEFLKYYNINIGKVEKEAIGYRNKTGHGHELDENSEIKLKYLVRAYRSLLNRCILKVLGYDGEYNDLFCNEIRNLNEHIPNEKLEVLEKYVKENKNTKPDYYTNSFI